jgi:hypothetical protein
MFKVMCVKRDSINADTAEQLPPLLNIGVVYTVEYTLNFGTEIYYKLSGVPRPNVFWSDLFAPLSDIDETEFVRETKTQPATLFEIMADHMRLVGGTLLLVILLASCTKQRATARPVKMDSCCFPNDTPPKVFFHH